MYALISYFLAFYNIVYLYFNKKKTYRLSTSHFWDFVVAFNKAYLFIFYENQNVLEIKA